MKTLSLILLMSFPAIVGFSAPIDLATERRAAIIATNAAIAVSAPVSNLAANAQSLALEALARPVGTDTNAVASIAGGVLETHNESATAHTDIRASVSNAVDFATGAVKTNSVGGLAIGDGTISSGAYSFAFGGFCVASGDYSFAFGKNNFAYVKSSVVLGVRAASFDEGAFIWGGDSTVNYTSKGKETFSINPLGGPSGFYIGETNLQTFLDEKLSIEHDSESSAHNGRITALENRPTGLTTNTVFPFMMLSDDYNTNGVVRVAVSNGVFSIWGMK